MEVFGNIYKEVPEFYRSLLSVAKLQLVTISNIIEIKRGIMRKYSPKSLISPQIYLKFVKFRRVYLILPNISQPESQQSRRVSTLGILHAYVLS